MANRLVAESSPYLRGHADDLIDWWPWGPRALAEARRRQLPVLLSVGYASCHWCHVMAQESFRDPQVAQFVNDNFVAIAVDREERPDVDQVFMNATQALTGQGGWPMTVFCTPDGEPFFAGTYFPSQARDGQPSFLQVCQTLARAWAERRDEVVESGAHIASQLADQASVADPAGDQTGEPPAADELLAGALALVDPDNGGFGTAPKFPQPASLDALMVTGEPHQIGAVQLSLEHIVRGGIHDIVGGGFHRYAVDAAWAVPHFEKMLDDNALLLGTLTRAWRRTGPETGDLREHFELAIRGIVGWLSREMAITTDAGTAFASGQDADSLDADGQRVEGAFYLWTPHQVEAVFNRRDALFAQAVFHLTPKGTMPDHSSTLRLHGDPDPDRLKRILGELREVRAERPAPARDDKVVAGWNGLLADSLISAAMVFGEPEWLTMARSVLDYLWSVHHFDTDHAARSSLAGVAGPAPAVLEDYAGFALGAARLAGATGDTELLDRAVTVLGRGVELFGADDGGFFDAQHDEALFTRARQLADEGGPSATSIMVTALQVVAGLTGNRDWADRARRAEPGLWQVLEQTPLASGWGLTQLAIDAQATAGMGRAQVAIVDPESRPMGLLARAVWRLAPEGTVAALGTPDAPGFGELFAQRHDIDGAPTAYICRDETCFDPVTDFTRLRDPLWRRVVRASLPADGRRKGTRPAHDHGPGDRAHGAPGHDHGPATDGMRVMSHVATDKPRFEWRTLRTAEFGFPGDQRDALVAAVLDGTKTATSEPLDGYRRHDLDPGDELGNYEVVVDSLNQPVALIRINSVATVPLADVDQAHAARDGRGFTTAAQWRTAHEEFWNSDDFRAKLGEPTLELGDDTPIVLLGFRTYRPGDVVAGHVVDFSDVPGA
ncbi:MULTISPECIES: DUF255 domain-containing protein [Propionibacterium]|uniref:DUF255 domain-containing protein n=1 Tax=Propionibacterium TaxID=1743 RepID=UPI000BC2EFAF|nr:DUF255 domain-containing protein [Propionibacterium freudenreichii]SBT28737.1 Conserved protein containing thioredoxin domain [Propionibacterium freudenreichii]